MYYHIEKIKDWEKNPSGCINSELEPESLQIQLYGRTMLVTSGQEDLTVTLKGALKVEWDHISPGHHECTDLTNQAHFPCQAPRGQRGWKDSIHRSHLHSSVKTQNKLHFAVAAAAKSLQSCPTLCDPIDSSPPGSPISGILQARTLEWIAISFSNAWKWKVKSEVAQSCLTLWDPMDCSLPGSSVHGIFQARVLEWVPLPSPKLHFTDYQIEARLCPWGGPEGQHSPWTPCFCAYTSHSVHFQQPLSLPVDEI